MASKYSGTVEEAAEVHLVQPPPISGGNAFETELRWCDGEYCQRYVQYLSSYDSGRKQQLHYCAKCGGETTDYSLEDHERIFKPDPDKKGGRTPRKGPMD